jgi:hypothetical protein
MDRADGVQVVQEAKRTMTTEKKKNTKRSASEEAVVSRARRMAKAQLKSVAAALGLDSYDEKAVAEKVAELKASRESGMGEGEKLAARTKELEAKLAESHKKNMTAKAELLKLQKQAERAQSDKQRAEIEHKISDAARGAGCVDPEYAIHLFRQHVLSQGPHKDNPAIFFDSLKKEPGKTHLFQSVSVGAGAQPVKGSNRSDAQITPDTSPPAPAAGGAAGQKEDSEQVEKLNPAEFNRRTQDRYGYRPGAA